MAETEAAVEEESQLPEKIQQVLDTISEFTLMELSELVEAFEERFDIEAAAAAPVAMAAAAPGAEAEEVEPTSYKVTLRNFGDEKIQVIKAVRSQTTLALKEAKNLVESTPATVREGLSKEEAEQCAGALNEAGGEAVVEPE